MIHIAARVRARPAIFVKHAADVLVPAVLVLAAMFMIAIVGLPFITVFVVDDDRAFVLTPIVELPAVTSLVT